MIDNVFRLLFIVYRYAKVMTFFEYTNFFVNFLMFIINLAQKKVASREATLIKIGML